jgi:hypothetical protein
LHIHYEATSSSSSSSSSSSNMTSRRRLYKRCQLQAQLQE